MKLSQIIDTKHTEKTDTDNQATNTTNAILLHSEDDGSQLPSLFVVENESLPPPIKLKIVQFNNKL